MLRYAASIFLGAFLLFQVQPLIARYILPWFGGTPAVWTTCMLFFQLLLLLGYLYAHVVISRLKPRGQAIVHSAVLVVSIGTIIVMAMAWGTPIVPTTAWRPENSSMPVLRILMILTVAVGLPYLVLSTTSPLLQAWFSRTQPGKSPYRLYTLSNIGSLLALLSYPVVVEPHLALKAQATVWSLGFVVYALAALYCAVVLWRINPAKEPHTGHSRDLSGLHPDEVATTPPSGAQEDAAPPSAWRKILWVALPAGASTLLLAVTNQMSQDIAVVPFLWILPLSLYLLSFVICFDNERWYSRRAYMIAMTVALPVMIYVMMKGVNFPIVAQIGVYSAVMFICCMVCHGELVALKPAPKRLTSFYLAVAAGGAIGGIFVGLIAPVIFTEYWELQISLAFCAAVGVGVLFHYDQPWAPISKPMASLFSFAAVAMLLVPIWGDRNADTVPGSKVRNFYGILQVEEFYKNDPQQDQYVLRHGRIWHGWQFLDPAKRDMATSYYGRTSGIGLALANHPRVAEGLNLRLGVVGLGTGTLAVYGRKGDYVEFYEINPAVPKLSGPHGWFTYLNDCPAKVHITMGDARISLERQLAEGHPQRFDVLALDAFSSDAIPIHLLTRECMKIYLAHMRDDEGIIAVHISNRALDLRPVVFGIANSLGLAAAYISDPGQEGISYHTDWVLLSRDPQELQVPAIAQATTVPTDMPKVGVWTDDFHNLFQIIRWRR